MQKKISWFSEKWVLISTQYNTNINEDNFSTTESWLNQPIMQVRYVFSHFFKKAYLLEGSLIQNTILIISYNCFSKLVAPKRKAYPKEGG